MSTRRETRANLIFLVVLACLMVPPIGVTLYRRWGKPGRLIEPPPVRDRLAYFDRTAGHASGHLSRVVPPQTGAYVAQLTRQICGMQRGLRSLVGDGQFAPIMSDGLTVQLVAEGAHDGKFRSGIVAWSGRLLPLKSLYAFDATRRGQTIPATLESYETQNMPIELRRELQRYGYILPPDGLIWMIIAVDGVEPIDGLTMRYESKEFRLTERLRRDGDAPAGRSPSSSPTMTTVDGLR